MISQQIQLTKLCIHIHHKMQCSSMHDDYIQKQKIKMQHFFRKTKIRTTFFWICIVPFLAQKSSIKENRREGKGGKRKEGEWGSVKVRKETKKKCLDLCLCDCVSLSLSPKWNVTWEMFGWSIKAKNPQWGAGLPNVQQLYTSTLKNETPWWREKNNTRSKEWVCFSHFTTQHRNMFCLLQPLFFCCLPLSLFF